MKTQVKITDKATGRDATSSLPVYLMRDGVSFEWCAEDCTLMIITNHNNLVAVQKYLASTFQDAFEITVKEVPEQTISERLKDEPVNSVQINRLIETVRIEVPRGLANIAEDSRLEKLRSCFLETFVHCAVTTLSTHIEDALPKSHQCAGFLCRPECRKCSKASQWHHQDRQRVNLSIESLVGGVEVVFV